MEHKLILNNLPEPIFIINNHGLVLFCNNAAETCFGTESESVVGRHLRNILIISSDQNEDLFAELTQLPMGSQQEKKIKLRSGEILPFEFMLTPVEEGDEPTLILIARDISERCLREERLNHSYFSQRIMNEILQISLMPISLDEQLLFILDKILAIPSIELLPSGAIFLSNNDSGILKLHAQRGFSAQQASTCAQVPFGTCHCGQAALTGEIQFVTCIDENHVFQFDSMKPHGHYCMGS